MTTLDNYNIIYNEAQALTDQKVREEYFNKWQTASKKYDKIFLPIIFSSLLGIVIALIIAFVVNSVKINIVAFSVAVTFTIFLITSSYIFYYSNKEIDEWYEKGTVTLLNVNWMNDKKNKKPLNISNRYHSLTEEAVFFSFEDENGFVTDQVYFFKRIVNTRTTKPEIDFNIGTIILPYENKSNKS